MAPLDSILIFGAGSVGCFIGAALAEGGAEVTLLARQRTVDEVNAHGITLSDLDGRQGHLDASRLRAVTELAAAPPPGLVLVTVKSRHTDDAAAALSDPRCRDAHVISFQNGVDNAARLAAHLGDDRVIPGMVPFNIVHSDGGRFHRATEGDLAIADRPALPPRWLPAFERAGLPLAIHSDFEQVQWAKLLLNLNNPINALANLPLVQELRDRHYRRALAAVMGETLEVLRRAGIAPARITPLPMRFVPWLLRLPTPIFERVASSMLAIDPHARSSMSDDLRSGRPTEIQAINGAVVALAERVGHSAPLSKRIMALIADAERAGPSASALSGEALWRALRG